MTKIRSKMKAHKSIRVVTTLYIDFSDAQGQITPVSVVGSRRNTNSSKRLCMPSLPAGGARWPSGRASDSGARGQGSIPTSAVLCP